MVLCCESSGCCCCLNLRMGNMAIMTFILLSLVGDAYFTAFMALFSYKNRHAFPNVKEFSVPCLFSIVTFAVGFSMVVTGVRIMFGGSKGLGIVRYYRFLWIFLAILHIVVSVAQYQYVCWKAPEEAFIWMHMMTNRQLLFFFLLLVLYPYVDSFVSVLEHGGDGTEYKTPTEVENQHPPLQQTMA
eukprot:TRINITY_DN75018_c0_g1_i1.p1 TRINITY_DN75018_c0_g1~~TRINITY_DN75018_c0_g1_i1.p1  ORF type:complete len:186 (+),score=23.01 TRINITY_DN75018_c0_g1_i1:51-608(+)